MNDIWIVNVNQFPQSLGNGSNGERFSIVSVKADAYGLAFVKQLLSFIGGIDEDCDRDRMATLFQPIPRSDRKILRSSQFQVVDNVQDLHKKSEVVEFLDLA